MPPFEFRFVRALKEAVTSVLLDPIFDVPNGFLKASLFHPTICRRLSTRLEQGVWETVIAAVLADIEALGGGPATLSSKQVFAHYVSECKEMDLPEFPGFSSLMEGGVYGTCSALGYWKKVALSPAHHYSSLLPIASMLLALPAGESHDEFVFSASGRIYSNDRNALSPPRLEQLTILVMFIRNFSWSHHDLNKWVTAALAQSRNDRKRK